MSAIEARGQTGRIVFDDDMISIHRDSFVARGTVGRGVKAIPLASVSAVQFKPATRLFRGYIEFTVPGGVEVRSRAGSANAAAARNENAVVFLSRQNEAFEALYAAIMARLAELRSQR